MPDVRTAAPAGLAVELLGLADRIGAMPAVGRNGDLEPFHIARSEARRDAQALAEYVRTGRLPSDYVPSAARDRGDAIRTSYSERRRRP